MNKFFAAIIIILAAYLSVRLYYNASGSLNPGKVNIISATGALYLLQCFIGISLIKLGFDKHYTLSRLIDREGSINITFWVIMGCAVAFPLVVCLVLHFMHIEPKKDYDSYLKKKTEYTDSKSLFIVVSLVSALCIGLMITLLVKIGYVPLIKMFIHDDSFNLSLERIRNSGITVGGQYVTNILIHLAIPVIAYFSFACALSSKQKKWKILSAIMFAASVIIKTYNFAKTPLIFFAIVYISIFIYVYGGIKNRWILLFVSGGILFLVVQYAIVGNTRALGDLYNGIWGRLFFTQVGTFSYNFDLFPEHVPFLMGRSFGRLLLPLFGWSADDHIRSGRIIMENYGRESVKNGTAGVMNSYFAGEAYANFGWIGLVISVIWVGAVIALTFALMLKMKKTPATVTMFAFFTINMATTTQGGFVDFVYNIAWVVIIAAMMICNYWGIILEKLKYLFNNLKNRFKRKI